MSTIRNNARILLAEKSITNMIDVRKRKGELSQVVLSLCKRAVTNHFFL